LDRPFHASELCSRDDIPVIASHQLRLNFELTPGFDAVIEQNIGDDVSSPEVVATVIKQAAVGAAASAR
jgi:hypothetical protein